MVIDSHSGMSSSGKLYGFGLPLADVAELFARVADELDVVESVAIVDEFAKVADSGDVVDKLAETAAFELSRVAAELDNSAELVGSAAELVGERDVVVSIIKLICVLFFCGKDSVSEFIGVKCFSDTLSANVIENAPKIAMINRIFVCMC